MRALTEKFAILFRLFLLFGLFYEPCSNLNTKFQCESFKNSLKQYTQNLNGDLFKLFKVTNSQILFEFSPLAFVENSSDDKLFSEQFNFLSWKTHWR